MNAQKVWNGAGTKWIVGASVSLTMFVVTGFAGFVIGHTQKPGHDVVMERLDHARTDMDEIVDDVKDIKAEQIQQRILLTEINQKVSNNGE